MIRMPTATPAAAMLKSGAPLMGWIRFGLIQVEGEEAKHHAWNRGKDLERRLEQASRPGLRVLREIDRGPDTERSGDQHRHSGDDQGAHHQRADVIQAAAREPAIGPQGGGVNLHRERKRVADQCEDDRGADDDREHRRSHEKAMDRPLASPSTWIEAQIGDGESRRQGLRGHQPWPAAAVHAERVFSSSSLLSAM